MKEYFIILTVLIYIQNELIDDKPDDVEIHVIPDFRNYEKNNLDYF